MVFVAGPAGAPLGYVTVARSAREASTGLIAVAESARGQGLGQRLVLRPLEFARAGGRTRMSGSRRGATAPCESCMKAAASMSSA